MLPLSRSLRRVRFAGNAREAGVPRFRRANESDSVAATAMASGVVLIEPLLQPRGYFDRSLSAIILQVHKNIVRQRHRHETPGFVRSCVA